MTVLLVAEILATLKAKASTAAEVVVATDVDPTGEGGLLFAEPMLELGITPPLLSRMYFIDEAPASIQKAFRERRYGSRGRGRSSIGFQLWWLTRGAGQNRARVRVLLTAVDSEDKG